MLAAITTVLSAGRQRRVMGGADVRSRPQRRIGWPGAASVAGVAPAGPGVSVNTGPCRGRIRLAGPGHYSWSYLPAATFPLAGPGFWRELG